MNNDWWVITGGDGFVARVDPNDPNIVYGESQYAGIVRLDRRTGERVGIKPVEGKEDEANKYNWETPFIISPHNPQRLYLGANRLYRSDDRGNSWKPVSPDLTRKTDRNQLPVMGRVWPPDAVAQHQSTATWGNISSVTESRKKEGMLIAGTDDGNVQVSLDGGANWRKSEHPPGLPDYNGYGVYVQRVYAGKTSEDVAYSLYENSKNGDFKPYIYKSTNRGLSWTSIAGDLPANGMTLAFAEDPVNPNLLFVGTEFGLYFTVNGGQKWIRLKNNLPTIPVRDLVIQERESDLVMATFGRGFYVLDNFAPLRAMTADVFQKDAQIFATKTAMIEVPDISKARGSQGEQLWTGENPPSGAVITYWIKTTPQSVRQKRQEATRAAEARKAAPPYPTQTELTAVVDEEAPQTFLTITDTAGKVVRRMTVPGTRGIHRFAWDLRGVAATMPTAGGRGGGGGFGGGNAVGPFVAPGTYRAALSRRVGGATTALGEGQTITVTADPNATLTPAQRTMATEYQDKVAKLQRAFTGALEQANNMKTRTTAIRRAIADSAADIKLLDEAVRFDRRVTESLRALRGNETLRGLESGAPSTIQSRVNSAAAGARSLTGAPTGTQQMNYTVANDELNAEAAKLRALESDLRRFEQQLEAAGVPYTPGRWPLQ
jgi:hypothetical protein